MLVEFTGWWRWYILSNWKNLMLFLVVTCGLAVSQLSVELATQSLPSRARQRTQDDQT